MKKQKLPLQILTKSPVNEEAKATVEEAKAAVKKTVKEVAQKIETTRIAETTIELPGCAVTMTAIEEAVKKDMEAKEISGKEINVYINIGQKAAYYTVDAKVPTTTESILPACNLSCTVYNSNLHLKAYLFQFSTDMAFLYTDSLQES